MLHQARHPERGHHRGRGGGGHAAPPHVRHPPPPPLSIKRDELCPATLLVFIGHRWLESPKEVIATMCKPSDFGEEGSGAKFTPLTVWPDSPLKDLVRRLPEEAKDVLFQADRAAHKEATERGLSWPQKLEAMIRVHSVYYSRDGSVATRPLGVVRYMVKCVASSQTDPDGSGDKQDEDGDDEGENSVAGQKRGRDDDTESSASMPFGGRGSGRGRGGQATHGRGGFRKGIHDDGLRRLSMVNWIPGDPVVLACDPPVMSFELEQGPAKAREVKPDADSAPAVDEKRAVSKSGAEEA